jgi:hypothetical protein
MTDIDTNDLSVVLRPCSHDPSDDRARVRQKPIHQNQQDRPRRRYIQSQAIKRQQAAELLWWLLEDISNS